MKIRIGKNEIGDGNPVFIIAEAGVNHNGSVSLAKTLIKAAKDAGADAVKFQTFRTEEVVSEGAKLVPYQKQALKHVATQFEMIKSLELSGKDHAALVQYAKKLGICFISTPGDFSSVDLLQALKVPLFKIGSDDLTNLPLIRYIAEKNKPILLSTGMGTLKEVREALAIIRRTTKAPVVIMHTTTEYPCPLEDAHLRALALLKETFRLPVGFSDHTAGVSAGMAAVGLGACVIEKHITLDRNLIGPDHKASYEPNEFAVFVKLLREVESCLGRYRKEPTEREKKDMFNIRKGIVASRNLPKGTVLRKEHLAIKRPQRGLLPKEWDRILGKKTRRDIVKDTPIRHSDLKV